MFLLCRIVSPDGPVTINPMETSAQEPVEYFNLTIGVSPASGLITNGSDDWVQPDDFREFLEQRYTTSNLDAYNKHAPQQIRCVTTSINRILVSTMGGEVKYFTAFTDNMLQLSAVKILNMFKEARMFTSSTVEFTHVDVTRFMVDQQPVASLDSIVDGFINNRSVELLWRAAENYDPQDFTALQAYWPSFRVTQGKMYKPVSAFEFLSSLPDTFGVHVLVDCE